MPDTDVIEVIKQRLAAVQRGRSVIARRRKMLDDDDQQVAAEEARLQAMLNRLQNQP